MNTELSKPLTLEDLAAMIADGFAETATKRELVDGLNSLRKEMQEMKQELRQEIRQVKLELKGEINLLYNALAKHLQDCPPMSRQIFSEHDSGRAPMVVT